MTLGIVLPLIVVVLGALAAAHVKRSLAERAVDALYRLAAVIYSMARALDAALVRYRTTRAEIRMAHTPMYVEMPR